MTRIRSVRSSPAPFPRPEPTAIPSATAELRIRNRRYWPWGEIVGGMLLVLFVVVLFLPFAFDRRFIRLAQWSFFPVVLAMAGYCLRIWLIILDLTHRPRPGRRETVRIVWNWWVCGIRPGDPGRVRVALALTLFGWLTPRRISVAWLVLGDTVAFDPRFAVPAAAVRRVRFAPDPAEDYEELDRPVYHRLVAVELDMGKEFFLILDDADARKLREWANEKGIAVRESDESGPRTAGPVNGRPGRE